MQLVEVATLPQVGSRFWNRRVLDAQPNLRAKMKSNSTFFGAIHVNGYLRNSAQISVSTRLAGSNKKGLSSNVQDYWDEYCKSVGIQGDNLDSLLSSATDKGINIVCGFQAAFDPMTGNIEFASNSKIWEFFEEFLHKKVAQGWKTDDIGRLTQQLRKVKDYKGYKSVKTPAIAAEEIIVKQWLLRHASLVGVGEAEKTLLQNQINQLKQYGTARGY